MKSIKSGCDFVKDYKLQDIIGKGSFGKVHKAIEIETGRVVAIKIIEMDNSDSEIDEIFKEIAYLGTCSSPYITQYYTSCAIGSKLWIVMEYLGGGSVLDLLCMGNLEERYCQIIIRDLLRGLNYLHMHKKIHRDIKCANILLSDTGAVKLADFGVAGQLTKTVNKRSTFIGTPFWMAPEIIKETEYGYGTPVDIWSTGIACIEMCDGKPPLYDLHPMKAIFMITKNDPPQPENQNISKQFRAFISQCLTKDPDFRPDAQTLLDTQFLKKAKKNHYLEPLIKSYKQFVIDNAPTESNESDDEGDEKDQNIKNGGVSKWIFETMRIVDRELVKSMVNDASNDVSDKKSNDSLSVKASAQNTNSASSSEEIDALNERKNQYKSKNKVLVRVFNQLLPKHHVCSKEINQFLELANDKDFRPFTQELTSIMKKYTPCQQ